MEPLDVAHDAHGWFCQIGTKVAIFPQKFSAWTIERLNDFPLYIQVAKWQTIEQSDHKSWTAYVRNFENVLLDVADINDTNLQKNIVSCYLSSLR